MDIRFIARSSAFLLPLVVLFAAVFSLHAFTGDYAFHLDYKGHGTYPPMLAWILNALELLMPRATALFLVAVLAGLYLPFILIFEITRREEAAWLYLYGTGVPLILFFIWFVPEALIQVLMLATIRWRWMALVFLAVGFLIHSAWVFAWLLAVGYSFYGKPSIS